MTVAQLNIAEVAYETGAVKYRYARYLADDGEKWIRHGLFRAYHPNGALASEGHYEHGLETGVWHDFHENGRPAAEGRYENGKEVAGTWKYWNAEGVQQAS